MFLLPNRVARVTVLLAGLEIAVHGQLNQNCTVSVLNRNVQVNADGSWVLPNIPANFGQVKARATCVQNGFTTSGESAFFSVPANGAVNLPSIVIGSASQIPVSLNLGSPIAFSGLGQTTQLSVIATYPDNSTRNVAAASTGTNYTSSNPAIANVNANGLVTAVSSGTVVIQAINDGAGGMVTARVTLSSADTDGDGIPDSTEVQLGLDPKNPVDAQEDFDRDNLTNLQEFQLGTDLRKADTDGDGLSDGEEVSRYQTSPLVADTDGDAIPDGVEVQTGSNPKDASSYDLSKALSQFTVTPGAFTLSVNAANPTASQQLAVAGRLIDGKTTIDLTAKQRRTNYASSNLAVCNFSATDGLVLAGTGGTCTITVTNSGFEARSTGTVINFSPTPLSFVPIPGSATDVAISGNYAYVAAGPSGLQVVDVTDRSSPRIVAALSLNGGANKVTITGSLAYVASGSGGMHIVDISNPLSPARRGTLAGGSALKVVARNGVAYIANGANGLRIANVTDPSAPQQIGSLALTGTARGIDLDGARNLAAIASTSGLQVVNVANPAAPVLVSTLAGGDVQDVAVSGTFAFLADLSRSFTSVDLTNPASPVVRASTSRDLGGLLTDVTVVGTYAMGADVFFVNGVPIIDISNPATPTPRFILDFRQYRDDNGTGIAADQSYVYMTGAVGDSRLYIGQYQQVVDNGGVAPTVRVTSPASGSTLIEGSTIAFSATATDDVGVLSANLLINGQSVFTAANPPYQTEFTVPVGIAMLTFGATALDYGGNLGAASNVVVSVIPDPLTAVTGSVVNISGSPVAGATVSALGKSATTAADGTFTIAGLPTIRGNIQVRAVFSSVNLTLIGISSPTAPVVGGTTNVGSITAVTAPVISSISPKALLAGQTITLNLSGANLVSSTFAFEPDPAPSKFVFGTPSIAADGKTAAVPVTIDSSASGRFTLVATNPAAASDRTPLLGFLPSPLGFNTVSIPGSNADGDPDGDTLTNSQEFTQGTDPLGIDTDADGFPDGLEVAFGANPLDANSRPNLVGGARFTSTVFSLLQATNPGNTAPIRQFPSLTFSLLNSTNPGSTAPVQRFPAITFSLLNSTNPGSTAPVRQFPAITFSILNSTNPGSTAPVRLFPSATFSVLNSTNPGSSTPPLQVPMTVFSVRNLVQAAGSSTQVSSAAALLDRRAALARTQERRFTALLAGGTDIDSDGLPDSLERRLGANPFDADSDGDRIPDGIEYIISGDPFSVRADDDSDFDGLPNIEEIRLGTDPTNPDSDNDGLADGDELSKYSTGPLLDDTDVDGYTDGEEIAFGTNPRDRASKPTYPSLGKRIVIGQPFTIGNGAGLMPKPGNQ